MKIFVPNAIVSRQTVFVMIVAQTLLALFFWVVIPADFFPKPLEIGKAWLALMQDGFLVDIKTSLYTTVEAIVLTSMISLGFVYLSVLPAVRPMTRLITKLRFNSLVGMTLFFTLITSSGHQLKLWLLVFGMTVWFVTSMLSEVENIPREEFDLARTLGMSDWRVVWEVVVRGTADKAFEVMRQNAAMGWMMLTMVEGIVRTEGGVGAMLLNQSKYLHLDAVFAIQISVVLIGISLDSLLGWLKMICCPYSALGKEAK